MKKKPLIIRANRVFAAVFYMLVLSVSLMGFWPHDSNGMIKIIFGSVGTAFSFLGMFSLFSKRFKYEPYNSQPNESDEPIITVTEDEVICAYPTKRVIEKVRWDNITKIDILTTDDGFAVCDVFIMLHSSDGKGVVIPQDCKGSKEVADKILTFPEFNYDNFIKAMGSSEIRRFRVWDKQH